MKNQVTSADSWTEGLRKILLDLGWDDVSPNTFRAAFIHKSFVNETDEEGLQSNERLEFLGDAILGMILSDKLMEKFPEDSEGRLSRKRSSLISEASLSEKASDLGLDRLLLFGKGEEQAGSRSNPRIRAGVFEAFLGLVYLNLGLDRCSEFCGKIFDSDMKQFQYRADNFLDFKTRLQEEIQKVKKETPKYRVVQEGGPDHEKVFVVEVYTASGVLGVGEGSSKRSAEQRAAELALNSMGDT